jgi:pyruvate dehydrogenase E2 component (dihydrolipoamide acetyltransferase)
MSNIRRKTAEHLSVGVEHDPARHEPRQGRHHRARGAAQAVRAQAEKAGGKMTMTAIAVKIVAAAMRRFPQFNASVDMARQEIVYKKSIHVGVAVDTERGCSCRSSATRTRRGSSSCRSS